MKVTLFMAMSLNGYIARKDGQEDFLSEYGWDCIKDLSKRSGGFIIGRKTYEVIKKSYKHEMDELKGVEKVVITREKSYLVDEDFMLASSPKEALEKLEFQGFSEVTLLGGSEINSSFASENLIDEVIINVEPVIIYNGVGLFSEAEFEDLKLELISIEKYEENGASLKYKVIK
jgi:dihydrofolate reductase